jgi:hypothetical protein
MASFSECVVEPTELGYGLRLARTPEFVLELILIRAADAPARPVVHFRQQRLRAACKIKHERMRLFAPGAGDWR